MLVVCTRVVFNRRRNSHRQQGGLAICRLKALLHCETFRACNLSRNVLATLWRYKLHETFHSVTYPATAKIVAKQVARAVAEGRIKF